MAEQRKSNPDELLRTIEREEQKQKRGRLRIFLGMCPGVGKTYSMLESAQEQARSGSAVVVGIVETHGRKETEKLIAGLKLIPRKKIEYREKTFEELDFEAVIKAKPDIALIDELAHTNIPGSLHPKRYQDVQEILDAGIDVYTTMNVQHIESRVDLVKQITGVTVHETVPDSFFELADQVELIDLPPKELLRRLKEGKVYLGEMAERAKEGFFKEEHLLALRELSLRFTAEVVDDELHDQMVSKKISGPWQTREKLLVAISHSPYSKRLIRAARRKAFNLEATWIALYVDSGEPLSIEDREMLKKNVDMAMELGAELVTIRESNIPAAIRRIAEEKNVTQIIMGRPDRRFFRDILLGGTLLDQLVRETSEIDIHVLRQERRPRYTGLKLRLPTLGGSLVQYSHTFWFVGALAAMGWLLENYIGYQAVGYLFLLGILLLASMADRGPILFGTILSTFVWNYCFIPPRFTFYIGETTDVMMNMAYFGVAISGSLLTTKIRRQQTELRERSKRTNLLYDFTRELAIAESVEGVKKITSRFIEQTLEGRCAILLNEKQTLELSVHTSAGYPIGQKALGVAQWVNDNGKKAGVGTNTLSGAEVFCLPLKASQRTVGVILYFPENERVPSIEQESILESIAASSAIAIERQQLQESAQKVKVFEESEKLYEAILDSVSHELRTPITAIIGAASALSDDATASIESNRKNLTEDIVRSAERLNNVIENLLDMSRVSSGKLELKKEVVEVSDLVDETVRDFKSGSHFSQTLQVECEPGVYTLIDAKMMEHVLFNLLRNASQYSPPFSNIQIVAAKDKAGTLLFLDVLDEGKGIPQDSEEKVFQKFFREAGSPAGGVGLGLSIVKGIVDAHGGRVSAASRKDRSGSCFRVTLPVWKEKVPENI